MKSTVKIMKKATVKITEKKSTVTIMKKKATDMKLERTTKTTEHFQLSLLTPKCQLVTKLQLIPSFKLTKYQKILRPLQNRQLLIFSHQSQSTQI